MSEFNNNITIQCLHLSHSAKQSLTTKFRLSLLQFHNHNHKSNRKSNLHKYTKYLLTKARSQQLPHTPMLSIRLRALTFLARVETSTRPKRLLSILDQSRAFIKAQKGVTDPNRTWS